MPTYLILMNGRIDPDVRGELGIYEDATIADANRHAVEHLGGELRDYYYYTEGPYDAALVVDYPDQETAIRARHQALGMGIDEIVSLDAVHHEDVDESLMT